MLRFYHPNEMDRLNDSAIDEVSWFLKRPLFKAFFCDRWQPRDTQR